MTDVRQEFQKWWNIEKKNPIPDYGQESLTYDIAFHGWQACQSLNDKRIQQLLAVIELQNDALKAADKFISNGIDLGYIRMPDADTPDPAHKTPSIVKNAISIKPENVELVEVGDFAIHEDKVGTRYPSQRMAYGYDEFKIGEINKLYTIKHKE